MLYLCKFTRYNEFRKQSKPTENIEILKFRMEQAFKYIWETSSVTTRLRICFETQRHFVHFLWSWLNTTKSEQKIR